MAAKKPKGEDSSYPDRPSRARQRFHRPIPIVKPVAGLPRIGRDAEAVLAAEGRKLYVGKGRTIEVYELDSDAAEGRCTRTLKLPEPLHSLTAAHDGGLYAWMTGSGCADEPSTKVAVVLDDRVAEIAALPTEVRATAVTRNHLAAVTPRDRLYPPELLLLDRRSGKLVARQRLRSERARIAAGRNDELLIEDPVNGGTLLWTDTANAGRPCPPDSGPRRPPRQPNPPGSTPPRDPCAPCCKPERPTPPDSSVPLPDPGDHPRDPCIPGGSGVPDDCIVTYVIDGVVFTVNICDPDEEPCATTSLLWPIGGVNRTPETVVATSRDEKKMAVIDRHTMRVLHEHGPGASAFRTLTATASETILLLSDTGGVTIIDPTPVLPALEPKLVDAARPVTFQGQAKPLNWQSGGEQSGTRNIMIVPVLEPGQGFNGSLSNYFGLAEVQAALEAARRYYHETSYRQPPDWPGLDLNYRVFGVDTPTLYTGPPVRIPNAFRNYWNEGWQPGGIEATAPVPAGGVLRFSGDEQLALRTFPEIVEPRTFNIRFPVASFRVRIAASATGYTLDFGPPPNPARVFAVQGTDRQGNPVNVTASTAGWTAPVLSVTIDRDTTLENGSAVQDLATALETLLNTVPGHPFDPPEVRWQDDGEEWGLLHVALFYSDSAGASDPNVTSFDADSVFIELSPGSNASIPASFNLPGEEGVLEEYLPRILADATVDEFGQSGIENSHFDYQKRPPVAEVEGGSLRIRISLGPDHGRTVDDDNPARIERDSQTGLAKIGMNSPEVIEGGTTKLSGSGAPTLGRDDDLFNDVFTAMVDAMIADQPGSEASRIDVINRVLSCETLTDLECAFDLIHNFVVVPVMTNPFGGSDGATKNPDVEDPILRATCRSVQMIDLKTEASLVFGEGGVGVESGRAKPVLPIGANRKKIFAMLRFSTVDEPERHLGDGATLAHELGHGLLSYADQYSTSAHREDLKYIADKDDAGVWYSYDYMGDSGSAAHMTSYHKRITGWLGGQSILLLDRPPEDSPIDREVVLVQLEGWDPTRGASAYRDLAQSLMPGIPDGTPVVAAAFLRLGGDGHLFNILELRGPGPEFSQGITTPRVIAINAVQFEDTSRYGEEDPEAEISEDALLRYRRQIHLLDDTMRSAGDSVDFSQLPVLAEAGLEVTLLEMAAASTGPFSYSLARVHIHWERGPAIDLGFKESLPDWDSPDIAVFKPDDIPEEGLPQFPENQTAERHGTFLVPAEGEGPLDHLVLARAWNFGDAEAFNVQVDLVQRLPDGGGDWDDSVVDSQIVDGSMPPGDTAIVPFNWQVKSAIDTHVCLRAQIGDRDPEPGASDDTTDENNWAQQNVFIYEAPSGSPPQPVEFSFSVTNDGPYAEEVRLVPKGLGAGSRLTVTPRKLLIRGKSRGIFRVRVELEERLLKARCNKDITFLLESLRFDDHAYEPWGACKYTIKPRLATQTKLEGSLLPDQLHLVGSVTPDVGAFPVLFHIDLPGEPPFWEERILGPGSTFDFVIAADIPSNTEVRATARFNGSQEYASSVSETLKLTWQQTG